MKLPHKLSSHHTASFIQWRVVLHDTLLDEVVQLHKEMISIGKSRRCYSKRETHSKKVLALAESIQIAAAEWQRSKVLVDRVQERFRCCQSTE